MTPVNLANKNRQISVVIATCNRRTRLLSLLRDLDASTCPLAEVIIIDSGEDKLSPADYSMFKGLSIQYVASEKSVCIQRNTGIKMATSPWILLCDDDIEIPGDYVEKLFEYADLHSEAGAISGLWLEKENNEWKATHPVRSTRGLLWTYFFQLGIWGEIECRDNFFNKGIKKYYQRKGNHISRAGWPVNIDFSADHIICPVYSLGASLVKRQWLLHNLFDEVLDRHGIGDNYGVTTSLPFPGVHVVKTTFVYHHLEPANRLKRTLQYYRRVLALDYFIRTKKRLQECKRGRLLWSLLGNMLSFILSGNGKMASANLKAMWKIAAGKNPYYLGKKQGKKIIEPVL
ncbi:MAG TPA: glycosyltransferase [Chitinophagaceae bacterium]|nr:glycosyltransferase [Chitinophagaceae bacterium]